jgi:hypothetical protein
LTPTVSGDVDSYAVSPALPAGLSIDTLTGVIAGTPTAVTASVTYTVTASNDHGSTDATITIAITPPPPSSLSYSSSAINATMGYAIVDATPSVSGSVASYAVSPLLPAGLSINTSTGVISGTPSSTSASAIYTVTATNHYGSTTANVTIEVLAPAAPSNLNYSGETNIFYKGYVIADLVPNVSGGIVVD